MSENERFVFPGTQLLFILSLVFWLLMIQFSLGVEFASYDYLIGVFCIIGVLIAVITCKGE